MKLVWQVTALSAAITLVAIAPAVQTKPTFAVAAASDEERLLEKGQAQAKQGNYQGAIATYNQALQANPRFTEVYLARGLAYHDLQNYQQAIADFNQALKIDPKNAVVLYNRGETRSDVGDLDGAMSDLNRAIEVNPNYAEAYNLRAILYSTRLGNLKLPWLT